MSGRQFFSSSEKISLQELIVKYKLNSNNTIAAGNPAVKKMAWLKLVEEFNSIETNSKRTESQLKKCWDNLKTRKKQALCKEKKNRMQTGGGPYQDENSQELIEEALLDQTDTEMRFVMDSDSCTVPEDIRDNLDNTEYYSIQTQETEYLLEEDVTPSTSTKQSVERQPHVSTVPLRDVTPSTSTQQSVERQPHVSTVPLRDVTPSTSTQQSVERQPHVSTVPLRENKSFRTTVISNEFELRKQNYENASQQQKEIHELQKREINIKIEKEILLLEKAKLELLCAHENLEIIKIKKSRLLENKEN